MKNRALINVADTALLSEFSRELVELGYEILCANNNISVLQENGVECTAITDDAPVGGDIGVKVEVMRSDIFAAILADRSDAEHISTIISSGIEPIDIVVTNFEDVKRLLTDEAADISNIFSDVDINRSSLIKAGISNCDDVCVVVDPSDYEKVLDEIKRCGEVSKETRFMFASKALSYLCNRDSMISAYLESRIGGGTYPDMLNISCRKISNLKAGENTHQIAAVYKKQGEIAGSLCDMQKLQGNKLSFEGYNNADLALECVCSFDECAVAVANNGCLCGVGIGEEIHEACSNAFRSSASYLNGSIVVFNRNVDRKCALEIIKYPFSGVVATGYGADTEDVLSQKEGLNLFIIENMKSKGEDIKSVNGGVLILKNKDINLTSAEFQCITERQPDESERKDLYFAWKLVKNIQGKGVVLAKSGQTTGIGGGQPSQISSFEIALKNAGNKSEGSVVAVDETVTLPEFFGLMKENSVTAIVHPGFDDISKETVEFCNKNGISMIVTNYQYSKF